MKLREVCNLFDIYRNDWDTSRYLASCAMLANKSRVSANTIFCALAGVDVEISASDRQNIVAAINYAKQRKYGSVSLTVDKIDWVKPPTYTLEELTHNEKTLAWQEQQNEAFVNAVSGHTRTKGGLKREEIARRYHIACGGQ